MISGSNENYKQQVYLFQVQLRNLPFLYSQGGTLVYESGKSKLSSSAVQFGTLLCYR